MSTLAERILLVDDEEPTREIMAAVLGGEGYRCRCVPNGLDALRLLESGEKFDLITSDIANSPMWGTSFLEQVKQRFPEIPTLVITACRDLSEPPASVRKGGYDGYLLKPFEREQLVIAVRRALESRRSNILGTPHDTPI